MAEIAANSPVSQPMSRAAYLQYMVKASNGQVSTAAAEEHLQASERDQVLFAGLQEAISSGRLAASVPDSSQIAEKIRAGRADAFAAHPGPVNIQAMNVDSLVSAQHKLTGNDLKNMSLYLDHLKSGIEIAKNVKGEEGVVFSGSWADKNTNSIDEYASWVGQAMRQNYI